MADTEVENTLREIRERVLASSSARTPELVRTDGARNGDTASHAPLSGDAGEALARMDANLSTTGRAWSRLPPVLTYRRGAFARVELWLKHLIKRAAHWFTWEQVNFNSAAHNALGDARSALDAHASALASLREELSRLRAEVETGTARAAELEARVSSAESRFDSGLAELRGALASALGEQRARTDELRERADGLLEEQRVSFRQLSLEAAELSVTHDRARRGIEARLEALEKRVTSDE